MITNVYSAKCVGIEAEAVTVEVEITTGIGIHLVGLADVAVKESLLRTVTALQFLGFKIPGRKIVINLAPADVRKNGSGYDLPIAIGILAASGQCPASQLDKYIMMGELGLDGSVRAVRGSLPIAEYAANSGYSSCILPASSAGDASRYFAETVVPVSSLKQVVDLLSGRTDAESLRASSAESYDSSRDARVSSSGGVKGVTPPSVGSYPDFAEIIGQTAAKRAAEIAAAGAHNLILIGPPGSGKSSIAKAMAGILPAMNKEESLLTSKIYSVAGIPLLEQPAQYVPRPFRAPHYSISMPALLGGGSDAIVPGEISLAHGGVLFLDEFCEIPQRIIESLRAPIEDGRVTVSRLKNKVTFPCSFILAAATNPCPCGYYGDADKCTCTPSQRLKYMSKLSGPIADRIDMQVFLRPVEASSLISKPKTEPSSAVAARVAEAREIQRQRFLHSGISTNSSMTAELIGRYCALDKESSAFLQKAMERFGLSARSYSRILRMARTIADLEKSEKILLKHLSEAVAYRFMDMNQSKAIL